jgi:hypothetical protein
VIRAAAAIVLAAGLAGCGGPSAQQELTRWQSETDATCRQVETRVAERGRPADVRNLDRVTVRAVTDVRAGMRAIVERPLPKGAEDRARPFVDAVRRVEPRLDELVKAGEFLDETRLLVAVDKVHKPAAELERLARRAGLGDCARRGFADRVSDALLTPLFVQSFNKTQVDVLRDFATWRRDRRVMPDHTVTFLDIFNHLSWMAGSLDEAGDTFAGLYPPTSAADLLTAHDLLVQREEELLWAATERVRSKKFVSLRRIDRRIAAFEHRRNVLILKLSKAIGTRLPRSAPAGEAS